MTQPYTAAIEKVDAIERLLPNLLAIDTLYSIPDNIAIWQEYTQQGNRLKLTKVFKQSYATSLIFTIASTTTRK